MRTVNFIAEMGTLYLLSVSMAAVLMGMGIAGLFMYIGWRMGQKVVIFSKHPVIRETTEFIKDEDTSEPEQDDVFAEAMMDDAEIEERISTGL